MADPWAAPRLQGPEEESLYRGSSREKPAEGALACMRASRPGGWTPPSHRPEDAGRARPQWRRPPAVRQLAAAIRYWKSSSRSSPASSWCCSSDGWTSRRARPPGQSTWKLEASPSRSARPGRRQRRRLRSPLSGTGRGGRRLRIDHRISGTFRANEPGRSGRAADAFILPSYSEGFSMAILEALACRLPSVITTACHFPELGQAGGGSSSSQPPTA